MLKSIIWADKPPEREALMPDFFSDLNLDQIVYKINSLRKNYDIKKLYYMLPDSRETLGLRQSIYSDIKKPKVFDTFCRFSECMKEMREALDYSAEIKFEPQKAVLYVTAAASYCDAVKTLGGLKTLVSSPRLTELLHLTEAYAGSKEYFEFEKRTTELYEEICGFFYRIALKRDTYSVKTVRGEKNYFDKIRKAFPEAADIGFESPFLHRKTLSHMETEAYSAIENGHSDCIKGCIGFVCAYDNFCRSDFLDLEYELQLYLSFNIFEKYMTENGFTFTTPCIAEDGTAAKAAETGSAAEQGTESGSFMEAEGVYDIALALTLFSHERPVIDNAVSIRRGERFLVVTGPNQGGKTTFARSVGQLVYFTLMGLDAAAKSASVPYFDGILTHFSVEESTETGQGKLKEELTRLAPMMHGDDKNQFVILNELFTTAATYDASVMGGKVMEHFIGNGCVGIYVTHIKELAEGEGIVSLVAVCDENDHHRRLYKMVRKPADGFGYAGTLVEKYGLDYDALLKRFENCGLTKGGTKGTASG